MVNAWNPSRRARSKRPGNRSFVRSFELRQQSRFEAGRPSEVLIDGNLPRPADQVEHRVADGGFHRRKGGQPRADELGFRRSPPRHYRAGLDDLRRGRRAAFAVARIAALWDCSLTTV